MLSQLLVAGSSILMFDWVLNTLLDNANFLHADIQEKKKPEDVYIYIYLLTLLHARIWEYSQESLQTKWPIYYFQKG